MEVVKIINEDELILIKGAVPGSKGTLLIIRDAIKPKSLVAKITVDEVQQASLTKDKKTEVLSDKLKETKELKESKKSKK